MEVTQLIKNLKTIPLGTLVSEEEVSGICNSLKVAEVPIIEVTLRDKKVRNILKSVSYTHLTLPTNREV